MKRNPALPQASEETIQRALIEHIEFRKRDGVYFFAVPNGGHRHRAVAAKLKGQGVRPGVPDLVFCVRGRFHGLELKREKGGRVSAWQALHRDMIEASGGVCAVAHGLDEAISVLKQWGAIG